MSTDRARRTLRDMSAEKTEPVMVRLTPEVLAQLKARAEREERTVAQTVRFAIRAYLEHS